MGFDKVRCGAGYDTVYIVRRDDKLAADCESVVVVEGPFF
jgi:hypothetical protein